MIALCPDCHLVKHIGLAQVNGKFDYALQHFMKVNNVNKKSAMRYIENCFNIYNQRSQHNWSLDLKFLEHYLE